jgi:hypothetical protein
MVTRAKLAGAACVAWGLVASSTATAAQLVVRLGLGDWVASRL